ncbi:hypothetical protein [Pararhodospirillum oryzae]|uniref:Uncharacterized protein n=1 Tax=Pararhodospirillum oryzae TaxID=478448 RepID=A0A512H626_9PROT|nr:hypothetical protein [Pararhodospirillum oryzae]GEO80878.1 hypothetical protein ROR02_10090 [Pararhodospirillum oryzae]
MPNAVSRARLEREKHDIELHARLRTAHENGLVLVYTNFTHLNRGGSPVFSVADNVGPLLIMLLGSVAFLFVNVFVGLTALLGASLFYVFGVRPWIARRLRERTIRMMFTNIYHWRALWQFGGVIIALAANPRIGCPAPDADWRAIARKFVARAHGPGLGVAGGGLPTRLGEDLAPE